MNSAASATTAGRHSRRRIGVAAAALVAASALVLTACTPTDGDTGGSDDGQQTQTLRLGMQATPNLNYTQAAFSGDGAYLWQGLYDTLLKIEPDGTVVPNAAESFELNEDATATTLTLREGMTFSDGTPVDAAAAAASIEHLRDAAGPDSGRVAGVEVEVVDDLTLVVSTPEPRGLMPMYLALTPGVIANPTSLGTDDENTNPQGSGPYVLNLEETVSGSRYVLDRNEDYWNDEAFPYDQLDFRVLPDQTARISALQTGQIDGTGVDAATVPQFENGDYNIVVSDAAIMGLHIYDREGAMVPALGDVRVRQAMNMVFDREAIVENLYDGQARGTAVPFTAGSELYDEEFEDEYAFDIERARELMAEAGYEDGFDLTIPSIPGLNQDNPMVVQQLGEIGIRVEQVDLPFTSVLTEILGGKFAAVSFPLESRNALWDLANVVAPNSVWNVFRTTSPELEALIAEAQYATGDRAEEVFGEIGDIVTEQAWFAPYAATTSTLVLADTVESEPVMGVATPYLYTFRPAE